MNEWISVDERLPEDRQEYLVFIESKDEGRYIKSSHLNPAKTGFYVDFEFDEPIEKVTHWMLLPPLPPTPDGEKP